MKKNCPAISATVYHIMMILSNDGVAKEIKRMMLDEDDRVRKRKTMRD